MNWKRRYIFILIILSFIAAIFAYKMYYIPLEEDNRFSRIIQIFGLFVALFTAVTALAVADTKKRRAYVRVKAFVDKENEEEYNKNEMSESLQQDYKGFDDPVKSYRVQFKMVNISGFTLIRPTLTFYLPLQRQHPQKVIDYVPITENRMFKKMKESKFRSNLFNSQRELRILEFADTRILSNSNLPYWNDQDEITIWIRMALNDANLKPFTVEISINCENSDGTTKKIKISPKELLNIS